IESQSTMDKFGNRPDLEFIQGDIAVTFEPNRVLPLGHVAHRLATAFSGVNVNGGPDFESKETSSSSETRLFSFFSPENTTPARTAPPNPTVRIAMETSSLEFMTNE